MSCAINDYTFTSYITATVKQTKKQLALAVILSGLLGIAVGLLVEMLNTVFHTPESLRMATRLPILGVIPFTKKVKRRPPARPRKLTPARSNSKVEVVEPGEAKPTAPMLGGRSILSDLDYQFLEGFRSLYTNIHLLSAGRAMRSLASQLCRSRRRQIYSSCAPGRHSSSSRTASIVSRCRFTLPATAR